MTSSFNVLKKHVDAYFSEKQRQDLVIAKNTKVDELGAREER